MTLPLPGIRVLDVGQVRAADHTGARNMALTIDHPSEGHIEAPAS